MIHHKTPISIDDTSSPVLLMALHDLPVPLVKIYTCGGLRIEVLQHAADTPTQARYGVPLDLSPARRGVGPGQTLLKMLISASKHSLSLDQIRENWHPTEDCTAAVPRVDNTVSFLRGLLCPPFVQGEQRASYRHMLVRYIYNSPTSGSRYALGAYPLLWIDVDALDWSVQQACRMERYGDDAFPFWERAYQLASQGVYLPEEVYSDWAEPRRSAVMGALRQSVHALKRLYLVRYGEQGQAELMRLLRDYLLQFPTDEDVLRTLMELLGGQERFQEVEQLFTRTKHYVEDDGQTLSAQTLDVWEYLRTKQIQRHPQSTYSLVSPAPPSEQGTSMLLYPQLAEAITAGIVKAMEVVEQKKRDASGNGANER